MLIHGNQSSLLLSEQCKGQGFDLLLLQLYVCFVYLPGKTPDEEKLLTSFAAILSF